MSDNYENCTAPKKNINYPADNVYTYEGARFKWVCLTICWVVTCACVAVIYG